MQRAVLNYVRNEWLYWVIAIVFALGLLVASAPKVEAKPILQKTVDTVQFYHDVDANTWYMKYQDYVTDMEESYDDIKVVWHGMYHNSPLILIAGQEGSMCEMSFRLYWFLPDGEVRQAKDFGTCYSKDVKVLIDKGFVVIQFDNFTKRVPLTQ